MRQKNHHSSFSMRRPHAVSYIRGIGSEVHGTVSFYQNAKGVFVKTELFDLPAPSCTCRYPVFSLCVEGKTKMPFPAGELPPIFGAGGEGFSLILTDRFTVNEIIGCRVLLTEQNGTVLASGEIIW